MAVVAYRQFDVADCPGRSTVGVVMAVSPTTTPFFEPRSVTVTTSVTVNRAWRRENWGSLTTTSLSRSRPTVLWP